MDSMSISQPLLARRPICYNLHNLQFNLHITYIKLAGKNSPRNEDIYQQFRFIFFAKCVRNKKLINGLPIYIPFYDVFEVSAFPNCIYIYLQFKNIRIKLRIGLCNTTKRLLIYGSVVRKIPNILKKIQSVEMDFFQKLIGILQKGKGQKQNNKNKSGCS